MINKSSPIPADHARAFATAVLAYEQWHPRHEGRQIVVGATYLQLMEVCELVAHYDDALPEQVFNKLRSFMHDIPHGRLIAALEAQRTYAVGAFCLRKMMEGRSDRRDQVPKMS